MNKDWDNLKLLKNRVTSSFYFSVIKEQIIIALDYPTKSRETSKEVGISLGFN